MKKILFMLSIAAVMTVLISCSDSKAETTKVESIAQIQQREGRPVVVEKVKKTNLEKWSDYTGDLEGTEQVTVFSMLGDDLKDVNVAIGDIVKKDEVVAEFSTDNVAAKYKQAKIGMETVEKTYNRMKSVYEAGGFSKQKLDEVEAQYKVAVENFNATSKLIKIKTPISGVIVDVFVDKGERVGPKTPICKVAKISELKTTIYIDESEIINFSKGQYVDVRWDAYKNKKFNGRVNKISLSADPKKRGFAVEILVDNSKMLLKPGIFADINVRTTNKSDIIKIPRTAIMKNDERKYIFVSKNNIAERKEVTTGLESGNFVEIISGLNVDENLIIDGQSLLNDKAKIKIIEIRGENNNLAKKI